MSVRYDADCRSGDRLHEEVTACVHDVESVACHVTLTDETRPKAHAPVVTDSMRRTIVGEDVPAIDRRGFAKDNVVFVYMLLLCQVLYDVIL